VVQVDSTLLGEYRKLITIVDADGDGGFLLRNDPGRAVLSARKTAGRWTLWNRMVMDPGPDGLWDPGEDNHVYSGSRTLLLLADTIQHEQYTPHVAGAPLLAGKTDSNLVWVDKIRRHPMRVRTDRVLIMAYRDTARNYPAFLRAKTDWAGGGVRHETVFGSRADSQFVAGDTVTLLDRAQRDGDSLRVEELVAEGEGDERPFHPKISHAHVDRMSPEVLDHEGWIARMDLTDDAEGRVQ